MKLVAEARGELLLERFERAGWKLTRAIEVDAGNPWAYFFLAVVRAKTGQWVASADLFERAADLLEDGSDEQRDAQARASEARSRGSRKAP